MLDGVALWGSDVIEGHGLVFVSIVALVALLSPIVIMVLDGVALGGFDIVEGHSLLGARVEIGAGLGRQERVVGVVVGWELEGLVAIAGWCLEGLVAIVVAEIGRAEPGKAGCQCSGEIG